MDTTITASLRQEAGKGAARKLRASGMIPAVMYSGGNEGRQLSVDPVAINNIFRKTKNRNTILHVAVDGASSPALVQEAQRHPVSRELLHLDLYALTPGQRVTVKVPLIAVGRPKGAEVGGRAQIVRRDVRISCPWESIPEQLEIDVSPLDVGDTLMSTDIQLGEGVRVETDRPYLAARCVGRRK